MCGLAKPPTMTLAVMPISLGHASGMKPIGWVLMAANSCAVELVSVMFIVTPTAAKSFWRNSS